MTEYDGRYRMVDPPDEPMIYDFAKDQNGPAGDGGGGPAPAGSDAKPGKPRWFLVALIALCAVLLVVGGALLAGRFFGNGDEGALQPDPNVRVGSLTGAGADLDKIADEAQVSFSINAAPVFATGTSPGNLTIENLEMNNNRFTVTINLKEDGREVYRSGYLDPGQYIESAPLSEDLPAGTYPAVATINTFRLSDDTPIGRVAAELVLHVEG